ncbi:MAG: HEAT repeat domain-containing protein [Planctomycetes bacterium]|nr:HEAT repeat domain-containing protein [Planctomycetota bacterium]
MKNAILIASLAAAVIAGVALLVLVRSGGDIPAVDAPAGNAPAGTDGMARGSGSSLSGGGGPGSGSASRGGSEPEGSQGRSPSPAGKEALAGRGEGAAPAASGDGRKDEEGAAGGRGRREEGEGGEPKAELQGVRLTEALTDALAGQDLAELQGILIASLTEKGTRFALEDLPLLFEALSGSRDYGLQKLALTHLSRLDGVPEEMVAGYLDYLRSAERPALAAEAFREITRAGGDPALNGLVDFLRETPSETMRWQAAQALGELGDARAVPTLSEFLHAIEEPRQAFPLAQSLIRVGGREAISSVLEYAAREGNEASLGALQQIRDSDAAPIIAESLNRRASEPYQIIALRKIRELGNSDVVPALARYLDRATGRVQGDAIETLASLRDPRAARTLEEFAARQTDERLASRAQRGAQRVRAALARPAPKKRGGS